MKNKKENKTHIRIEGCRFLWGLLFIVCAVLLLLDAFGVGLGFLEGIPLFTVALGILLLAWILKDLIKLKIGHVFFPLAFLFLLFEKHIAGWIGSEEKNLVSNWVVLLAAVLLSSGTALLRPKKLFRRSVKIEDSDSGRNHHASLGSSTVYIDCTTFEVEQVRNELGACQVFFSNIEQYRGNGTLIVCNELGSMKIHVPSAWKICSSITNELGSLSEPEESADDGPTLCIRGENELGSIAIVRV